MALSLASQAAHIELEQRRPGLWLASGLAELGVVGNLMLALAVHEDPVRSRHTRLTAA